MAGIRTKEFSLLNIKDTFDEASEALFAAIAKANPSVDFDSFDMELRQLVMRYGRGGYASSLAETTASLQETKPVFVEAGDVLVLARLAWKSGKKTEALKLFVTAQDCKGLDPLMEAIHLNNSKSEIGEISAQDDNDEEEDAGDETSDDDKEEDDKDIYPVSEDVDEDEEETEASVDRAIANLASLTGTDDDDEDSNVSKIKETDEEDKDTEENDEDDVPMGNTTSNKLEAALRKAAANKLSLTGTDISRRKADKILRRA